MSTRYDRRDFLSKGARGAAAVAALGAGGSLLEACGGSKGATSTTGAAPSGVTDHKKPKRGGAMAVGTWSEVNGLSPPTARWDATGYLYGNALFDTLVQIGADGKPHPYLAQSFTSNPDFTKWTFTLRPGVEFHSGEPLDAAAVVNSLEAVRTGIVTSQTMKPIESMKATGKLTLEIDVNVPWPAFPSYLSGQIGYICSPKMLASSQQGATKPIGTGPYLFGSWEPGNHLTTTRNPRYWQKGRPYLDTLTFKPLLDNTTRAQSLESGVIDVMHCQAPQTIKPFFTNDKFQVILGKLPPRAEPDVDFIMLNLDNPLLADKTVRQALAMAINRDVLRESYGADLVETVSGPFTPGEVWYAPTGYPAYDTTSAKKLISTYTARTGQKPTIKLTTIEGPQYLEVASVIQQQWQAIGVTTTVGQVDFTEFVTNAVVGAYEACTFEQFGATDPDQNYIWWSTDTYGKIGAVSLNMARNQDSRIQAALDKGRSSTNLQERAEQYQAVSKYLAEDLPYLWLDKTYWTAVTASDVVGVTDQVLPGNVPGIGFNNGAFLVQSLAFTK